MTHTVADILLHPVSKWKEGQRSTRGVNLEHRKAFPHWIFFQEIHEYIHYLVYLHQVIEFVFKI